MNELQKRFEERFQVLFDDEGDDEKRYKVALNMVWDFFHTEITDMLERVRLKKQEYEPDYPIPNTDTVEGYNSAVDDLNNKIEREKK